MIMNKNSYVNDVTWTRGVGVLGPRIIKTTVSSVSLIFICYYTLLTPHPPPPLDEKITAYHVLPRLVGISDIRGALHDNFNELSGFGFCKEVRRRNFLMHR